MFARSTTFHGRPENADAGIAFVTNEVGPALDAIEGYRGLSLLVDRMSGQSIATSSWEDEATMRASASKVSPVRDRGLELFGGTMEVDEWEIAVMHRTAHGSCCRVSWGQAADLARMVDVFRMGVLPQIEQAPGFCSASFLINSAKGVACATTAWETTADMAASRDLGNRVRTQATAETEGTILDVREFELAYAHLHVPELV